MKRKILMNDISIKSFLGFPKESPQEFPTCSPKNKESTHVGLGRTLKSAAVLQENQSNTYTAAKALELLYFYVGHR